MLFYFRRYSVANKKYGRYMSNSEKWRILATMMDRYVLIQMKYDSWFLTEIGPWCLWEYFCALLKSSLFPWIFPKILVRLFFFSKKCFGCPPPQPRRVRFHVDIWPKYEKCKLLYTTKTASNRSNCNDEIRSLKKVTLDHIIIFCQHCLPSCNFGSPKL